MYIFLDESGKPEVFSSKGTNLVTAGTASKYLVIAAVKHPNQIHLQQETLDFKSQLLSDPGLTQLFSASYALDAFHAHLDKPAIRERFYQFINFLSEIEIHAIVVDKLSTRKTWQLNPANMYSLSAGLLLKDICHQDEKTEIIFSRKDSKLKSQKQLEYEVEKMRLGFLDQHPRIQGDFTLSYQRNRHYTHAGLQIADYAAYALFQVYEHNDKSLYELTRPKIRHIFDLKHNKHFTRSRPLELSS